MTCKILLSWIGRTDIKASEQSSDVGLGPIAQAITQLKFDHIVLFSNYPKSESELFIAWLQTITTSSIKHISVKLSSPTHFGEIYTSVTQCIDNLPDNKNTELTFHLSPGTPAMAAVWIILAKTRYVAELIESSKEQGVKTVQVPFDLSAEYIPDLYKRSDEKIKRLGTGHIETTPAFESIVHNSDIMKRVIAKAQKVAPRSVPVLIEGDSGTGKELLARAIHNASLRRDRPFVAVNCGAISTELIESEFFGHEKSAFTGAINTRKGYFEAAHEGTLFLDEIGELPLALQVKFLRVLQEGEVTKVGASQSIKVDVRIIAATHRNLIEDIESGLFREDLLAHKANCVTPHKILKNSICMILML